MSDDRWDAGLSITVDSATRRWLEEHPDERELLGGFVALMARELAANNDKGNRPGWSQMDRKQAIAEVHWHASKLAVAAKRLDERRGYEDDSIDASMYRVDISDVREYAADVANCAFMALDCMGLLGLRTGDGSDA